MSILSEDQLAKLWKEFERLECLDIDKSENQDLWMKLRRKLMASAKKSLRPRSRGRKIDSTYDNIFLDYLYGDRYRDNQSFNRKLMWDCKRLLYILSDENEPRDTLLQVLYYRDKKINNLLVKCFVSENLIYNKQANEEERYGISIKYVEDLFKEYRAENLYGRLPENFYHDSLGSYLRDVIGVQYRRLRGTCYKTGKKNIGIHYGLSIVGDDI